MGAKAGPAKAAMAAKTINERFIFVQFPARPVDGLLLRSDGSHELCLNEKRPATDHYIFIK